MDKNAFGLSPHKMLLEARHARPKGMRPYGLRRGRNILPEPWKKIATSLAMRSRVSASLQSPAGTAAPPLSALAALLCRRHVGSGGMSDSVSPGEWTRKQSLSTSFMTKDSPETGGPSHVCGHRLLSLYRTCMFTSDRSSVQASLTCWKYLTWRSGGVASAPRYLKHVRRDLLSRHCMLRLT